MRSLPHTIALRVLTPLLQPQADLGALPEGSQKSGEAARVREVEPALGARHFEIRV